MARLRPSRHPGPEGFTLGRIRTARLSFHSPLPPGGRREILAFLGPRAIPAVESVRGPVYRRLVRDGSGASLVEVTCEAGGEDLVVRVHHGCGEECTLGRRDLLRPCRRLFDMDARADEIRRHLARDPLLARRLRSRPVPRVPGAWDPFETAVRALLGQQISVKGATTLAGRLVERIGTRLPRRVLDRLPGEEPGDGKAPLRFLFPSPEKVARSRLERIGMPGARVEALRGLAAAVAGGEIRLAEIGPRRATPGSLDEAVAALCRLRGIGPWTAQYLAMRVLKHPDAFPSGDLGLLKATGLKPVDLERRAERWRPFRAYAALCLWRPA